MSKILNRSIFLFLTLLVLSACGEKASEKIDPIAITPISLQSALEISIKYPTSVDVADLDADGKMDLVVTDYLKNINIYLNESTDRELKFSEPVVISTGFNVQMEFVEMGDLDGDGKQDLVVRNSYNNQVLVLRNTSTGVGNVSFAEMINVSGKYAYRIKIGDLNGDGKPDLALVDVQSNAIWLLRNTSIVGTISFDEGVKLATPVTPTSLVIADLNGDYKLDIAVVSAQATSNSTGVLSLFKNISSITEPVSEVAIAFESRVDGSIKYGATEILSEDLDNDGSPDLIILNSNYGEMSVFINKNSGDNFQFKPNIDYSCTNAFRCAIGDLNGDNNLDIGAMALSSVYILRNLYSRDGVAEFDQTGVVLGSGGTWAEDLAIVDINGDGIDNLIVAKYGHESIIIFRNKSN